MPTTHTPTSTPPGRRVDIGGFTLHALVEGQGKPVVVLEPALGGLSLQWQFVVAALAPHTQVIAYDRAGQGWSDPSPHPRTPRQLNDELRALLRCLAVTPPYVLAGHSFGGLLVRRFAADHPDETVGVVLVDSSHEDQNQTIPNYDRLMSQTLRTGRIMTALARFRALSRFLTRLSLKPHLASIPEDLREPLVDAMSRPQHQQSVLGEFLEYRRYFGPANEIPASLGDLPLTVITAEDSLRGMRPMGKLTPAQMNAHHQALQDRLAQASPRGRRLVVADATHFSILLDPRHAAQVAQAILDMVQAARS